LSSSGLEQNDVHLEVLPKKELSRSLGLHEETQQLWFKRAEYVIVIGIGEENFLSSLG